MKIAHVYDKNNIRDSCDFAIIIALDKLLFVLFLFLQKINP